MPRPRKEFPSYRRHSPRNCGKVVVDGRPIYFPGDYLSNESMAAYRRWLANYLATGIAFPPEDKAFTIGELILSFDQDFISRRYVKNGRPDVGTSQLPHGLGPTGLELRGDAGRSIHSPGSEAVSRTIDCCRVHSQADQPTRDPNPENVSVGRRGRNGSGKRFWRSLLAVSGLRRGEALCEAKEVPPVPENRVEAIHDFVTPPVWAMIPVAALDGGQAGRDARNANV